MWFFFVKQSTNIELQLKEKEFYFFMSILLTSKIGILCEFPHYIGLWKKMYSQM